MGQNYKLKWIENGLQEPEEKTHIYDTYTNTIYTCILFEKVFSGVLVSAQQLKISVMHNIFWSPRFVYAHVWANDSIYAMENQPMEEKLREKNPYANKREVEENTNER